MDRINFDKISSKENGIDSPKIMIKLGSFKIIFFLYKNYRNSYVSVIRKTGQSTPGPFLFADV